ncbi:MAG: hypothetical protein NE334_14965 [Lentisphaeraceae bacterium]|nr:hypothetical protein [Lentisphaeraceae bacterium]
MNKEDIKLISWSLTSEQNDDADVVSFMEKLSKLPEEDQIKIINSAEKLIDKDKLI